MRIDQSAVNPWQCGRARIFSPRAGVCVYACICMCVYHLRWWSMRGLVIRPVSLSSRFNSHQSEKKKNSRPSRHLYAFVSFFIFPLVLFALVSLERGWRRRLMVDYGKERDHIPLGFYSSGIKYEQSVREIKPYCFIWESMKISGREEQRQSVFTKSPPVGFPFLFWFTRLVLHLSITFGTRARACVNVYSDVLYTCDGNYTN